jgi:Spy/CpxP family protein refolding chaperone
MADRHPRRENLLRQLVEAERHVAESEEHVSTQEGLIAELDRDGHDTTEAKALLETMRQTQALHRQDVVRILKSLGQ